MPFAVIDLDGCLEPDIHEAFAKRFIRKDSAVEHALKEVTFNAMDKLSYFTTRVARKVDHNIGFDENIVASMKLLQKHGFEIVVRTANRLISDDDLANLEGRLMKLGVEAHVERAKDSEKFRERNGERPYVILDDKPNVVMMAGRLGITSILLLSDYNRAEAAVLGRINRNIRVSKPEAIPELCESIVAERARAAKSQRIKAF
ncbi:MAG: hypothetical protein M1125_01780 [Candidatus Marsarchaeota archaeon]|nr:hypothetical protein [Candidatus Marsarchaeota archaeon]